MTTDAERLARRTSALVDALAGMPSAGFSDDAAVAALLASPGYRVLTEAQPDALATIREARIETFRSLLASADPAVRGIPNGLTNWLCGIQAGLVHPMTGESLSRLDWVLRGGNPDSLRMQTPGCP